MTFTQCFMSSLKKYASIDLIDVALFINEDKKFVCIKRPSLFDFEILICLMFARWIEAYLRVYLA